MPTKQDFYTPKDSSKAFIYGILMPQIVGIFLTFLAILISYDSTVTIEEIFTTGVFYYLVLTGAQLAFLLVFVLYNNNKKINWLKASGIKNKITPLQIGLIIVISLTSLFLFAPFINLLDYLYSLFGYAPESSIGLDLNTLPQFLIAVLTVAVLPAICEELLFRGMIFNGLKKLGHKKAILLSALAFALMHTSLQQTVYQFILGVILAYVVYYTGSLLAGILLHFFNNFTVILISYLVAGTGEETTIIPTTFMDFLMPVIYILIGTGIIYGALKLIKLRSKPQEELETTKFDLESRKLFVTGIFVGVLFWVMELASTISIT